MAGAFISPNLERLGRVDIRISKICCITSNSLLEGRRGRQGEKQPWLPDLEPEALSVQVDGLRGSEYGH